jgi:predicted helicase
MIDKVSIGRPFIIHQLHSVPPVINQENFLNLLEQFFSFSIPTTTTAKALAIELAKRTRFLRDNVIAEELKEENIEGTQTLEGFYRAFKEHLIPSLTPQDFANLFAQTITYGLFAARSRAKEDFNRKLAFDYIPPTIGILRDVFRFISSTDLPQSMEWIIDDIAEVLRCSDVQKIMENFYKEGKGHDPIIHFYETFLAEYDPKEREKRGVYYTPEPIVSYITRSIHKLLKEKFNKNDGFADKSVIVLDPAAGTLTFPAFAINLAIQEFKEKYGEGGIHSLIKDHILKDFYAFELMMAPYAIGHLKIGLVLDNLGYQLTDEERFNLYLTNTLDFSKEDPNQFPGVFEQAIAKESQEALKVKEEVPVMVVMGNPPYSVSSTNIIKEGSDYYELYESYKEIVRKEERNIQPLSDDYIKFIAFAHWKIKQAGQGIVRMITNNSYLDGLIHRDMRRKLAEDFNEIYILNLHGNSKRQETTPDGSKDENVFDIQQGVSIILMVKI